VDAVVLASHLADEGTFRSQKYKVIPWLCRDGEDLDYWRGYASLWESDLTIVGLEHDIEWTDDDVADLLACPHQLCSRTYVCHWASTGVLYDIFPVRNNDLFVKDEGTKWAERSAIGFVKITPEARIGPLEQARWNHLEESIERAVQRPWHLHWPPVPHHHW
jgi:hypothetical protein